MRTQRALFMFAVISAVAFGLFSSQPAHAQPSTGSQSTLLPTSASHAFVLAAQHYGGGGSSGGGAWRGSHSWQGPSGSYRPYRRFYGGGYYVAPYYVGPYCDNPVWDLIQVSEFAPEIVIDGAENCWLGRFTNVSLPRYPRQFWKKKASLTSLNLSE